MASALGLPLHAVSLAANSRPAPLLPFWVLGPSPHADVPVAWLPTCLASPPSQSSGERTRRGSWLPPFPLCLQIPQNRILQNDPSATALPPPQSVLPESDPPESDPPERSVARSQNSQISDPPVLDTPSIRIPRYCEFWSRSPQTIISIPGYLSTVIPVVWEVVRNISLSRAAEAFM